MTKFSLEKKVCLVTGGNSGIGLGMADSLAQAGADVCIIGRDQQKLDDAHAKLTAHGGKVLALQCDVSDEQKLAAAFDQCLATLGPVDSCFANAGVPSRGTAFHEMTTTEWREITSVNLDGVFFTFRAAIKQMLEAGRGGSLVVTSSLSAHQGQPRGEHYASSKGGVLSMVRSLAVEYARYGIRANAIVPGWIDTPMTAPLFGWEKFAKAVMPRIPQRRWGLPEDFGAVAVYLASDASAYHSGDDLLIDGAYSLF